MANMVKVHFTKAGTPYGYGYAAGEYGVVREEDFKDSTYTDDKGKQHVKPGLLSRGIVRQASDAEYDKAMGVVADSAAETGAKDEAAKAGKAKKD